jgi:hypothetical protein
MASRGKVFLIPFIFLMAVACAVYGLMVSTIYSRRALFESMITNLFIEYNVPKEIQEQYISMVLVPMKSIIDFALILLTFIFMFLLLVLTIAIAKIRNH